MAVYIASDEPWPTVNWDDERPAFYVAVIHDTDAAVRSQFSKPHVMYAGSHEGCGCGFQYGEYPEFRDADEAVLRRASLDQFADYLDEAVRCSGAIELYACWEGDQAAAVEHRRTMTPQSLRLEDFFFKQREFSIVSRTPAASA
jgi:hypothetical protein